MIWAIGNKLNRDSVPVEAKALLDYSDLHRHYGWSKSKVRRMRQDNTPRSPLRLGRHEAAIEFNGGSWK